MRKLLAITIAFVLCLSAGAVFAQEATDTAQYYTTTEAAVAAADGRQFMVIEFYTDW